jgi:tetratricopeptide (TPR) repeat protein
VRGEPVTTAADVYSLGLLLYQLLTGVNPQPCCECSLEEALRIICEREPAPPSSIKPELDRDLEAIVMKAIEKPAQRRYASVQQMIADLQAWLEHRPVSARKMTAPYLAGWFVARHRWPVSAAAALLLTAAAGVTSVLWQAKRTGHQRQLAERRFNHSRRLIRTLVVDLQEKLRAIPATVEVRKSLVEEALKYLEELAADAGDRPDLLLEIVETYAKLGELQGSFSESSLGDADGADRTFRKGLDLVDRLLERDPANAKAVIAGSKLHANLGLSQSKQMTKQQRQQHQVKASELARRARVLNPRDRPSREFLAASYFYTATARIGQPDELDHWNKALELSLALHQETQRPNTLRNVALVRKNLSGYWARAGQSGKALAEAEQALAMDAELLRSNPADQRTELDVAIDHNEVAMALYKLGRGGEAIPHLLESVRIRAALAARNPRDARFQDRYAFSLFSLSHALRKRDPKQALEHAGRALEIWKKLMAGGGNVLYEMEIAKAKVVMGAARNASGGNGCRAAAEGRSALMALPAHLKLDGTVAEMVEEAGLQLAKCR